MHLALGNPYVSPMQLCLLFKHVEFIYLYMCTVFICIYIYFRYSLIDIIYACSFLKGLDSIFLNGEFLKKTLGNPRFETSGREFCD